MVIAERILTLRQRSEDAPVRIEIFLPVEDKGAWGCRWIIHWPDRLRQSEIFGYDSAQALILSMQAIGSEIYASDEHKSGNLRWGDSKGGYGFPLPQIFRDLMVGEDAEYF
jgi:hypothetical protein